MPKVIEGTLRSLIIGFHGLNPRLLLVNNELPEPPPELASEAAQEQWRRAAAELALLGLMASFDHAVLVAYCHAYSRWLQAERTLTRMGQADKVSGGLIVKTSNGNAIQNPIVGIANKAMRDMVRFANELGLTPSARQRMAAPPSARLGKKEQAVQDAVDVGSGDPDWGDDLASRVVN
jgi:P27 family predicted phage terminase small subunit